MKIRIIAILCLGFIASGCATNRGIVDVSVPETANPDTTILLKITEVRDRRVFQIKPPVPSIPSLKNDEINDQTITKRAIARKRNTYGMGLGDILLPPGRSVDQLARGVLENALRESGYAVVSEDEPGYETARALTADIEKFWSWVTPGFWQITLQFEAQVVLKGDWPVEEGKREVYSMSTVSGMAATTGLWEQVFNTGIAELTENVKTVITEPPK
ncbi:MAG: hypothetical protein KAR37_01740 [Alphaproteobacteria bacterium]|nr:hypothetical protein [Alphaproteobacteria bacterium]